MEVEEAPSSRSVDGLLAVLDLGCAEGFQRPDSVESSLRKRYAGLIFGPWAFLLVIAVVRLFYTHLLFGVTRLPIHRQQALLLSHRRCCPRFSYQKGWPSFGCKYPLFLPR